MTTFNIGKWLVYLGIAIVIIGLIVWSITKLGIPLGKLPGDIKVEKEKYGFYFPIVSSIVISIILTVILNLIFWLFRKP